MRRNVIWLLMLLWLIACGGGTKTDVRTRSGPTQFSGLSAQFRRTHGSMSGQTYQVLGIGVFDIPPWCYPADGGTGPMPISTLGLEIVRAGTEAVGPGTWSVSRPVGGLPEGAIGYFQRLADPQPDVWLEVNTGSLRLSRADEVAVEGEVELTLDDGTRLEGQFSATPQCIR